MADEMKLNDVKLRYIDQNFGYFTDILGYHKSFQIVDYTMTNIQKISQSEIVSSVPASTLHESNVIILNFIC